MPRSGQRDLFSPNEVGAGRIVLRIQGIRTPRVMGKEKPKTEPRPNYHIPSFKNSKRWVTKTPRGRPLDRPLLITSPEFQKYMDQVVANFESQLLSCLQTDSGETLPVRSKLLQIVSLLPADDSCSDLPEGHWKVRYVAPGQEGAIIEIEPI